MKTTERFKETISKHLNGLAETDLLFAETLKKPNKNIDDCITYILNTVQKSGCNGFTDDEVFGMAIHYYDEEDVKVGAKIDCQVIVNHTVELTPKEIQEAKQAAIDKVISQQREKMINKPVVKNEVALQPSLFDL